ncbi:MAG: TolC family protein [Vicinamibacterales bacterium]
MTRSLLAWALGLAVLPVPATAQPASEPRLTIEAAVQVAVTQNLQVQSARLEIDKADAALASARTRRLPSVRTEVSVSQLLTPVAFAFPQGAFGTFPATGPIPATNTTLSVDRRPTAYVSSTVAQPLSQLFTIGLTIDAAGTSRALAVERARAARLAVVHAVTRAYFGLLQTKSALVASDDVLAMYRELGRTVTARVAQKVALRADALEVEYRLAQEELAHTTYENALASGKEELNRLLGRDVGTPFAVTDAADLALVEVDLDAAVRRALENRPDVREARLAVDQATLDERIARAGRIPDVSFALSYVTNLNIDVLPANLASAGIQLTWEPFDWGRRRAEIATKASTVAQARLAARDAEDRARVDVSRRYRTLMEKRALLRVASMAQDVVRETLRVRTNQYQVQAALLPDVLQVRAELAQAVDRYQQALSAFWTAKADFELAIGED